jgi:hypothetical protein
MKDKKKRKKQINSSKFQNHEESQKERIKK